MKKVIEVDQEKQDASDHMNALTSMEPENGQ